MKKLNVLFAVIIILLLAACQAHVPAEEGGLRIVSTAPAATEILAGLGLADSIVAYDSFSQSVYPKEALVIDAFDITKPNMEAILSVSPTLVFVSEINRIEGEDPFSILTDSGARVVYLPTAVSIEDVSESIRIIGEAAGKSAEADKMAAEMLGELESIRTLAAAVETPRTVYFELDAEPKLYSFGANTFLNELLLICNCKNIFEDTDGWLAPSDESVIVKNPDVILTNNGYVEGIVDIIKERKGFSEIAAVKNGDVFLIDPDSSSRPSQHITKAVRQIAEVVYPEIFK